jgi:hypothetical protein
MEKQQQLVTGKIRKRDLPLAEKLLESETLEDGIKRAVKEELGSIFMEEPNITIIPDSITHDKKEIDSYSYPGLLAQYTTSSVKIHITNLPEQMLPPNEFTTWENKLNPITNEYGKQITTWQWIKNDKE